MEDLLREVAVEFPSLVGIIIVVWMFLRALQTRDVAIKEIVEKFAKASSEQTEEMKRLREVVGANSEVIKRCTGHLNQITR